MGRCMGISGTLDAPVRDSMAVLEYIIAQCPVKPGTNWRHYKGKNYVVQNLAIDCNTNEVVVVYSNPSFSQILFTRTLAEWNEDLGWTKRFELIK